MNALALNKCEQKTMEFVSVAEFRLAIGALERAYSDRHACVGSEEIDTNKKILNARLQGLFCLDCKRKKPDDQERKDSIINRVAKYLGLNRQGESG